MKPIVESKYAYVEKSSFIVVASYYCLELAQDHIGPRDGNITRLTLIITTKAGVSNIVIKGWQTSTCESGEPHPEIGTVCVKSCFLH